MDSVFLKSNAADQKVSKKKNKQWPSDRFFYPHLTSMKDSYTLPYTIQVWT